MERYIIFGEALEFGFWLSIAEMDDVYYSGNIDCVSCPRPLLKDYLEQKCGKDYNDLRSILKDNPNYDEVINTFLEIYKILQKDRRSEKISVDINKFEEEDKQNLIRLLKIGYQLGLAFRSYIDRILEKDYKVVVEPNLRGYKPDFVVFKSNKLELIGDIKSYISFVYMSKTLNLSEYIEQFSFKEFNSDEIEKPECLHVGQFRSLVSVAQKYWKVLRYVDMAYEYFEEDMFPIKVCLVLPGVVSVLEFENYYKLIDLKNKLKKILPKKVYWYYRRNRKEKDIDNKVIEQLFPNYDKEFVLLRDQQKDCDIYYLERKVKSNEVERIEFCRSDKFKRKLECKYDFGWVHEIKGSDIDEVRKKHKKKFLKLLFKDYDLIINASEQGIGKNYTLNRFIEMLKDRSKIILFCPRKKTIIEIANDLKKLEEKGKIKVEIVFSERDTRVYMDKTYKDQVVPPEGSDKIVSATKKLRELLNMDAKKPVFVLVTSQTLPYLLASRKGLELLLSTTDYLIIDELTNSEPAVRESFIKILRGFIKYKNHKDLKLKKIVVLDASITSYILFEDVLKKHVLSRSIEYTPFGILKKSDSHTKEFNLNGLRGIYFKEKIDFDLSFGYVSYLFDDEDKILFEPNWNLIFEGLERLFKRKGLNFSKLLKNNKVLFYIDNKMWIESLLDYLKSKKKIECEPVYAERRDEIDKDKNVIGTSSLAFGTSFPNHEVLVVFPSYFDVQYFKDLKYVELTRQVIKRLRGGVDQLKHVVLCAFTKKSEDNIGVYSSSLKHFIKNILTNRDFHVRVPYATFPKDSIFVSRGEIDEEPKDVPLERFLRTYLPSLKRLFQTSGFLLKEYFVLELSEDELWKDIPSISFLIYKLRKSTLLNNFELRITKVLDENALKNLKENLKKDIYRNTAYKFLRDVLGYDPIEYVSKFKNPHQFKETIVRKLKPKYMVSSNSTILVSVDLVSQNEPKEYYDVLMSKGSPLRNLFFGDSKYFETIVNIKIKLKDDVLHTVGFLCYHPKFGENPWIIRNLLKYVISREVFREDILILPQFTKLK